MSSGTSCGWRPGPTPTSPRPGASCATIPTGPSRRRCAGRPRTASPRRPRQVARELLPKLPPDYQPLANARLAMATRAADAPTVLRGVSAARLDEPAIKLERAQWLRRTGSLDDAKSLLTGPVGNQNDTWWNE